MSEWKDCGAMYIAVAKVFSELFTELERGGILDPLNEVDLYCLHYIFLPRINRSLEEFHVSWNNHSLSTAGNLTPNQLLFEGSNYLGVSTPDNVLLSACTADVSAMSNKRVAVPRINFQPCSLLAGQLTTINTSLRCQDNGCIQCIHIVGQHLTIGCNDCSS